MGPEPCTVVKNFEDFASDEEMSKKAEEDLLRR